MDADGHLTSNHWWQNSRLAAIVAAVRDRPVLSVAAFGIVLRFVAIPVTLLGYNPYAQQDAQRFAIFAQRIGTSYLSGPLVPGPLLEPSDGVAIHRLWGLILSPFYALPGPSQIYALIVMVALGGVAIYNVSVIGRRLHSPIAGALAALPVAVYPSFVLIHTTLLREAIVLVGITLAARMLIVPPRGLLRGGRIAVAAGVLAGTTLLRPENLPLYLAALVVGAAIWYWRSYKVSRRIQISAGVITTGALAIGLWIAPRIVDALATLRTKRARGSTAYLVNAVPEATIYAIAFMPLGAFYFLFTPLPWMVHRISDAVVFVEALGNLGFAVAAIFGLRWLGSRHAASTAALVVGFVAAVGFYGLVEGNVGAAVRHRQMFVWVLYVFGAVVLVEWRG